MVAFLEYPLRICISLLLFFVSAVVHAQPAPIEVAEGSEPQVAMAPGGSIYVVYGKDRQIFFTRSRDAAKTFSTPVKIAEAKVLPLGMRRGPRIVVAGNAIVVTAVVAHVGKGKDGDINAWRSTDGGETWDDAGRVNDMIASAREGLHDLASDGEQRLFCVWLDLRNDGKTQLYGSLSRDAGQSWEENTRIYRSPDGHICECCQPSAVFDQAGNLFVLFRNSLDGNRDMYLARSSDAKKFADPKKLGLISWKLNGCPMDGGDLACDPAGYPLSVWREKESISLSRQGVDQNIGAGRQPVVTVNKSGTYFAWLSGSGELIAQLPGGQPHAIAKNATDPVLASTPDSTSAYCFWESNGKIYARVIKAAGE